MPADPATLYELRVFVWLASRYLARLTTGTSVPHADRADRLIHDLREYAMLLPVETARVTDDL